MAGKQMDLSQKELLAIPAVFADILNGTRFQGEQVVKPESLMMANPQSIYRINGDFHEQARDTAMYWMDGEIRLALFGIENQRAIDRTMPIRIMNYDAAEYRNQLRQAEWNISARDMRQPYYPVVSTVLYFGETRWRRPTKLSECLEIPQRLLKEVSEYEIDVCQVAFLEEEEISRFRSDFKIVVRFCVWHRETGGKEFYLDPEKMEYPVATLRVIAALAGKPEWYDKIEAICQELEKKGDGISVTDYFTKVKEWGIEEGIALGEARGEARGRAEGRIEGRTNAVRSLMHNLHLTMEQAMNALEIPKDEQKKCKELLLQ